MLRVWSHLFLAACLLCLGSVHGEVCLDDDLPNFFHGIRGRLCFIDQTTLVIRGFSYDGQGPAAYLYYYEPGAGYDASNIPRDGGGKVIPHPDTNGRFPSMRVTNEDLQFTLPQGVYACDMAVFTIWCDLANTHFTAIDIPQDIFTTSPSEAVGGDKILCTRTGGVRAVVYENCEQLGSSMTVEWELNRTEGIATFQLCGCRATEIEEDNTWLGFGLSGSNTATQMLQADATIVWVDTKTSEPNAVDYFLTAQAQCRAGVGACPDTLDSSSNCNNDAVVVSGSTMDDVQCVTFNRSFTAGDDCDRDMVIDGDQYIVWGIGGLEETAFIHFARARSTDPPINFGREPVRRCTLLQCISCNPFVNKRVAAPSDTTFVARIGPSGGQRGYQGITGNVGWGISWYINDMLIPELVVERGKTYTFIVYGGDDPSDNANYHPLYITDSENGGRNFNTDEQKDAETVYAGVVNGQPVGVGPLCAYDTNIGAEAKTFDCGIMLCHYEQALTPPESDCGASASGNSFTWTPDSSTPDLVYYQCLTHRNLGWRIIVTDSVEDYLRDNSRGNEPPEECPSDNLSTDKLPEETPVPTGGKPPEESPVPTGGVSSSISLSPSNYLLYLSGITYIALLLH